MRRSKWFLPRAHVIVLAHGKRRAVGLVFRNPKGGYYSMIFDRSAFAELGSYPTLADAKQVCEDRIRQMLRPRSLQGSSATSHITDFLLRFPLY